jgi:hypothetical protein
MITVKLSDGLGNQMFQYAFGKAISAKRQQTVKFETSYFQKTDFRQLGLEKFNVELPNLTTLEHLRYNYFYQYIKFLTRKSSLFNFLSKNFYPEKIEHAYDPEVFTTPCNYFSGYWQDYRFFEEIRAVLLHDFTLLEKPNLQNSEMLHNILTTDSVSLHIRRGDYLAISGQDTCTTQYYRSCIDTINQQIDNPTFFIFSDDMNWVKENFHLNHDVFYVDFNNESPEHDLNLMKYCKHNIIANSTFSWWGAWLNDNPEKIVLLPKQWRANFPTPDGLIPVGWKVL